MGNCIVELSEIGEAKGNFESRLEGALETIAQIQHHKHESNIKTIKDQTQYLREISQKTGKENPRNLGMI